MRLKRFLPSLLLLVSYQTQATTYYVNAAASGTNTGLNWANAFTDPQVALSIAIPGDEVWVAAGQYKPTATTSRTVSFVLRNGVNVYGGFAGTETSLAQRDIASNPTVLNGDIGALGDNTDNSHNVVTANNITTNIVLDGFRIMNGYSGSAYRGGGLSATNCLGGSLLIRQCSFINNYATGYGGGLYLAAANVTVDQCEFNGNSTDNSGGAICDGNNNGGYSNLTILDSKFTGNVAYSGACLYNSVDYQNLVIDRCVFTNNTSDNSIIRIEYFETARILNSYVIGNSVDGFSSNILYVNSISPTEDFQMINCTIADNVNVYGFPLQDEAVRLEETYHAIHNCIIYGNTRYAGRQVNTAPTITNSIVEGGHVGGTNIIDLDPEFTAPHGSVTANFDATAYDYTLQFTSPAVNSGDNGFVLPSNTFDLAGNTRIQGGVVDMGCYESDFSVGSNALSDQAPSWYFSAQEQAIRLVEIPTQRNGRLEVIDLSGRVRARAIVQGNMIPLDLPTGLYLATLNGYQALKFVVAE